MASFAKIDFDGTVLEVVKVNDDVIIDESGNEREDLGQKFLSQLTGYSLWKKTSYNTRGGIHYDPHTGNPSSDQTKSFRKNFAGIGCKYDSTLDAFIPPKLFNSWIFNKDTCLYDPPISRPDGVYFWDEANTKWVGITTSNFVDANVNPPTT